MLTPDRAIDDFLGDCRRRRWSERSIRSYSYTLYEFADRLPVDLDVSKISTDDVRRYLATKAHLAPGTVANHEAHVASWLRWLYRDRKIASNPIDRLERTRRIPAADLDVISVDPAGVRKILAAGHTWTERLAPAVPAYLGPRRHAVASLRVSVDYDRERLLMRFREKGSKVIWKPVPDELARLIEAAEADGAYERYDYLVPPEGYLQRSGDRDDRVIWRVVRRVAARAGVDSHVHALRAAFACFYLERNPGDLEGLKELMGHRTLKTTEIYLRKLDKQTAMERVRDLSWGVSNLGDEEAAGFPQRAEIPYASSAGVGAGGFEPPSDDTPDVERAGGTQAALEPLSRRLERARERAAEREKRR
jgi:integrase